jgi:hypothetical protein
MSATHRNATAKARAAAGATPDRPNPIFTYEGSGLTLKPGVFDVGPFQEKYPATSFGMKVDVSEDGGVPEICLRPSATVLDADPCTDMFSMRYTQDVEWEMIFRLTSDPGGGLTNTFFSLEARSNYPDIGMSIKKAEINQAGFGLLMQNALPADYAADLTVRFWDANNKNMALDGWIMLEVAYIPNEARGKKFSAHDFIGMKPIGRAVLYPAHQQQNARVIGDNYPRQVRRRAK